MQSVFRDSIRVLLITPTHNPCELQTPRERRRAIVLLYRICKALASKRLRPAREMFKNVSVEMFPPLAELWLELTDGAFAAVGDAGTAAAADAIAIDFDSARSVLKLLRVLLGHGFSAEHQSAPLASFLDAMGQRLEGLVRLRGPLTEGGANAVLHAVERCIVTGQKLHLDLHMLNPVETAAHLSFTVSFALDQIFAGPSEGRLEVSGIHPKFFVLSNKYVDSEMFVEHF